MSNETERAIKTAILIEEATRLLQGIAERQREYHDTEIKRIDALSGELARRLLSEIDLHRASILRAKKFCEEQERKQLEEEDTRPEMPMLARRDPTPPLGIALPPRHIEDTAELPPMRKPAWERLLGVLPFPKKVSEAFWSVIFGAAGYLALHFLAGIKALFHGG